MKARIKENAGEIFLKEALKVFKVLPPTYLEYYQRLKDLAGKVFEAEEDGEDRLLLKYDKPKRIKGCLIVGISVDKRLVEIIP